MTVADLYNNALGLIGLEPIRATTDPTKTVKVLNTAYPLARYEVLRSHPWPCLMVSIEGETEDDLEWEAGTAYISGDHCVVGTSLYRCSTAGTSDATVFTESTNSSILDGSVYWQYRGPVENETDFLYAYIIPNRTLRIIRVGDHKQYQRQGNWLYTNEPDAILTLIIASEDPEDWDAYIQNAISLKLATMVGLALGIDAGLVQALKGDYRVALAEAQAIASGEASEEPDHDTMWVDV